MTLHTVEIEGRLFEDATTLKGRIGIAEMTLWRAAREDGMPAPIKIGARRYYERKAVDRWLLGERAFK
jgi:predicted DNA-binding transcriptional regulator AlpA